MRSSGSSTAATTAPASRPWSAAGSSAGAPKASSPISSGRSRPSRSPGVTGIGHTRWATHGAPTQDNAHPHEAGGVAVVHNGIVENFQSLRAELTGRGHRFATQTDTEVVPQLVSHYLASGLGPVAAAAAALKRLDGAFALAMLFAGHDDLLICARRGSPLAIGYGEGEMYIGSDALALAPLTNRIQYLEEGDWAVLTARGATVYAADGAEAQREIKQTAFSGALIGRGNYRHFMHKEIHEQPVVLGDTLRAFASPTDHRIALPELPVDFATLPRLAMVACGTASYACMVGRYWFEQLAGLPVDLDIGSEFRYRGTPLVPGSAALFVSQSGETMDTLEAMRDGQGPGADHDRARQRPGQHARARGRLPPAHARRPRDRGRLDQGVHDPAGDACLPCDRRRPRPRPPHARARGRADPGARRGAGARRRGPDAGCHSTSRSRSAWSTPATCSTSAAARASRSRSRARSSSRRSATSTPRATPPASSSTGRSR